MFAPWRSTAELVGLQRRAQMAKRTSDAGGWFTGYGLYEQLPDHSSLTPIRQWRGEERFREIFKRTVESCLKAKVAIGEIVHIDPSLIRERQLGQPC
jgi:hypothetical protein